MKMSLRRTSLILFFTLILSLVWASSSGQLSLHSISPGNPDAGGAVAVVESISRTVSMTRGKAQKIYCKSIFSISKIAPGKANRLLIRVIILNPQDMGEVLGNPHAYINVTVSNSAEAPGTIYAWDILSRERGEVVLRPQNVPDQTTTLYIQVSIMVPGGPPPGQQKKNNLNYYCMVELN